MRAALLILIPTLAHAAPEIEFAPVPMRTAGPADASDADADVPAVAAPTPADVAPALPRGRSFSGEASRWIEPYGAIAGGVNLQSLHQMPDQTSSAQNPTVAISRLGLRGGIGEHVSFASEIEASLGGGLGYGASVWEGQAALAIRDQFVRYTRAGWSFAVGRIDDPASFDFVSSNIGDLLYADMYTRDPLLYSGADRGNGLFGSYALTEHLTAGLTFHSTNPTGITGTLEIGGKLQPFDRPFYLAAAQVGNSQNSLPDQNLHIYFGSPSLMWKNEILEVQGEVQMYSLDTQVAVTTDQTIRGYNLRLGARAKLGKLTPFANVSRNRNEILDPTDSLYRLPDLFRSYTFSTGADYAIDKRFGIGAQYALVDTREPDQHVRDHYLNVGATWWIEDGFAVGLRGSVFAQQISGETMTTGSRSIFATARLVMR